MVSSGEVVVDVCHQNADIGEGSTSEGLFHISTNTHMYLEDSIIVNTKDILLNWRNCMQGLFET